MKRLFVVLLILLSVGVVCATDINGGSVVYPSETKLIISPTEMVKEVPAEIVKEAPKIETTPKQIVVYASKTVKTHIIDTHYGYDTPTKTIPWLYYYKVRECKNGMCTVVRADFITKKIWLEVITENVANDLTTNVPAYEALPKGELL